jgi:hypothetical protein
MRVAPFRRVWASELPSPDSTKKKSLSRILQTGARNIELWGKWRTKKKKRQMDDVQSTTWNGINRRIWLWSTLLLVCQCVLGLAFMKNAKSPDVGLLAQVVLEAIAILCEHLCGRVCAGGGDSDARHWAKIGRGALHLALAVAFAAATAFLYCRWDIHRAWGVLLLPLSLYIARVAYNYRGNGDTVGATVRPVSAPSSPSYASIIVADDGATVSAGSIPIGVVPTRYAGRAGARRTSIIVAVPAPSEPEFSDASQHMVYQVV